MPRNINANLLTRIQGTSTTLCQLFRLFDSAGNSLVALTDHNEDVTVTLDAESVTFLARPGLFGSRIASDITLNIDNAEVGAYVASGVLELKLLYGQSIEGARFKRYICDYLYPAYTPYCFQSGTIGEIPLNDYAFKVALRSLAAPLAQALGEVISSQCRAGRVGELLTCNFAMLNGPTPTTRSGSGHAFRLLTGTISVVENVVSFRTTGVTQPTVWFADGVLRWTSGFNTGIEIEVRSYVQNGSYQQWVLQDRMGSDIAPGDTFTVDAGCNHSASHCYHKFKTTDVAGFANGNIHNIQAELHLSDEAELVARAEVWDRLTFNIPAEPAETL